MFKISAWNLLSKILKFSSWGAALAVYYGKCNIVILVLIVLGPVQASNFTGTNECQFWINAFWVNLNLNLNVKPFMCRQLAGGYIVFSVARLKWMNIAYELNTKSISAFRNTMFQLRCVILLPVFCSFCYIIHCRWLDSRQIPIQSDELYTTDTLRKQNISFQWSSFLN